MDVTGIVIITSKFADLDKILLRRFYELSLYLQVQNFVNYSDWAHSFAEGHVIPGTWISNCLLLGPI
jgi:hypothetical protein